MKSFNFATALGVGRSSWTCRRCLAQAQTSPRAVRHVKGYSNRAGQIPGPKRRNIVFAATGGAVATAVAFTEPVTHAYEATERTARVASTLFVCINEYAAYQEDKYGHIC